MTEKIRNYFVVTVKNVVPLEEHNQNSQKFNLLKGYYELLSDVLQLPYLQLTAVMKIDTLLVAIACHYLHKCSSTNFQHPMVHL